MMDLTPLDVRKKKGDFRRGIRGYEQAQVDDFLDLVADRMEVLVRQASSVGDRIARLEQQVADYRDREKALTEALVTAQQMREDIRTQSTREVELLRKQAEQEADRIRADAVRMREREEQSLEGLRSRQFQFLASYRKYLEQELAELAAVVQGVEMHTGGPSRAANGYPGGGRAGLTPPSIESTAAPHASSPAPASSFRDAAGPVAGPAASPGQPVGVAGLSPTAAPVGPPSFAAPPPAAERVKPSFEGSSERAVERATAHPGTRSSPEPPSARPTASPAVPAATTAPLGIPQMHLADEDAPDVQLEEALARWEPELGPEPDVSKTGANGSGLELDAPNDVDAEVESTDETELELEATGVAGLDVESTDETEPQLEPAGVAGLELEPIDETEPGLESAGAAELELESADVELDLESGVEDDLLLSTDDEVAAADSGSVVAVEAEDDVDLSFLEFGEDDSEPAIGAAAAKEAANREVNAALVESDGDYIDIGTALGDEPDEIELPVEAIADQPAPAQDEADAAIDAAFDFDDSEAGRLTETRMSGPRVKESVSAQDPDRDDDLASDIEFVDSLLMDAGSLFEEEPPQESLEQASSAPAAEAAADPTDDGEFDDIAAERDSSDDYRRPEHADAKSEDRDLINLDTFRGFATPEPPAPSSGDVSSLTLHPMFFEQESSELEGREHEESRQDYWSSSGGG